VLVIDAALRFLNQPIERLDGSDPNLLHPRLELATFLSFDRQNVAGRVDPPTVAVYPRNDRSAPFPGVTPNRRKHPHRIDLG
jgi:hypothetical protein